VSALTAGLFSVVSAPVANAAVAADDTGNIASLNSTTGAVVTAVTDTENNRSLGIVSVTGTATAGNIPVVGGASITGNILPTAQLSLTADAAAGKKASMTISGGVIISSAGTSAPTVNGSGTAVVAAANADAIAAVVRPTGAVGSTLTIQFWNGASLAAGAETNGTLSGTMTFTLVASGTAGIFNAGESNVSMQVQQAKGTACSGTATFDDVSSIANNATACIHVNPKDAYGTAVTTGTITASATNNAKVLVGAANAAAGFLAAAPFSSVTSAANLYVAVTQATANTGGSTVVTITWNGVVIGTKTITFQGDFTKLTLLTTGATASNTVYSNGATNAAPAGAIGKIFYSATDALGTAVTLAAAPTISDATGAMTPAVLDAGTGSNNVGTRQSAATGFGFATMTIAANPLRGAGTYRLKLTNAAGTDIKSDVINATVSGGVSTFSASWDKASYAPGENAILTISAKDSSGNPVAQGTAMTGGVLTANTAGLTNLTCPSDISTSTFNKADGSRACTFAVGNTAGSYSYSMALTNSSGQSATAGSVKIVTPTVVTNEQVLQSIVALIASINKQIQALQKLILKR
jgi:hypothetical protein